jgi:hypothetical protein
MKLSTFLLALFILLALAVMANDCCDLCGLKTKGGPRGIANHIKSCPVRRTRQAAAAAHAASVSAAAAVPAPVPQIQPVQEEIPHVSVLRGKFRIFIYLSLTGHSACACISSAAVARTWRSSAPSPTSAQKISRRFTGSP